MNWAKENATWPHSERSRFVRCKPHLWHVQDIGEGSILLLLHGAGGSTHCWQHLIPELAKTHRVIAIDLPGQGFTKLGAAHRCGLDAMAEDIIALCKAEDLQPTAIIAHSAGVAIALRMAELTPIPKVIGINAALDTFHGIAGFLFPALAKTIAATPFAATALSAAASSGSTIDRVIKGTGANLSAEDLSYYRRLVSSRTHVQSTLRMMAQWQLEPLLDRLKDNHVPTLLIAAEGDKAVLPVTSVNASRTMPNASAISVPNLGHLAQEEEPKTLLNIISDNLSGDAEPSQDRKEIRK